MIYKKQIFTFTTLRILGVVNRYHQSYQRYNITNGFRGRRNDSSPNADHTLLDLWRWIELIPI